ncbi:MAG: DUF47 domain-containing protein [Candidatus Bathyarchaeia archaeon]|jgi:uncharacterized protein Yka (UPF0111/DUF47 family)
MKRFRHFLVVGEESIFGEIAQIITVAEETNKILLEMLGDCKNEKILDLSMQKVRVLEKKSDDIAFKVNADITTGAVSPNILDSLLESVSVADDIVDNYYYQSRQLSRMCKAKFPYSDAPQEAEWIALFKNMLGLAGQALVKVKKALFLSDLSEILKLRLEIEALEQQGDDIKDKGLDWLYHEAPRMHYLQFYHYSELLHKFDDILDGCEDLSDLILSVITSILK